MTNTWQPMRRKCTTESPSADDSEGASTGTYRGRIREVTDRPWRRPMASPWVVALGLVLAASSLPQARAACVMHSACKTFSDGKVSAPCVEKMQPIPANWSYEHSHIAKWCPHLVGDREGDTLCCDDKQANTLAYQLEQAEIVLGSCKTCMFNFARLWCDFACSPDQDQFVSVLNTSVNEMGKKYVTTAGYQISTNYVRGMLESCSRVSFSSAPSLELVCKMSKSCRDRKPMTIECIEACLSELGTYNPERHTPLNTNFELLAIDPEGAPWALKCDDRRNLADHNVDSCSCNDCAEACTNTVPESLRRFVPLPVLTLLDYKKYIDTEKANVSIAPVTHAFELLEDNRRCFEYDCSWFVAYFCLVIVGISLTLFFFLYQVHHKSRVVGETEPDAKANKFATEFFGMRDRLDSGQRFMAEWYAEMIYRYPRWIIVATIILAFSLALGVINQDLLRTPVEIWTSENSRSRIEKRQFEDYFGKEARYTQVILRPHVMKTFNSSTGRVFGPAFDPSFQIVVFDVIQKLLSITAEVKDADGNKRTIRLEDACQSFFGPGTPCKVLSPFGYFQNDPDHFLCVTGHGPCGKKLEGDKAARNWSRTSTRLESRFRLKDDSGLSTASFWSSSTPRPGPSPPLQRPRRSVEEKSVTNSTEESSDYDEFDVFGDDTGYVVAGKAVDISSIADRAPLFDPSQVHDVETVRSELLDFYTSCIDNPLSHHSNTSTPCCAQYGGPLLADIVFGGWAAKAHPKDMSKNARIRQYSDSVVLTILLDADKELESEAWEAQLIKALGAHEMTTDTMWADFITARSIQDEIDKASMSDVAVIAICYLAMGSYVIFGLARYTTGHNSPWAVLVTSKILVGFMASASVLMAVLGVMGFFGWVGVKATIMSLEVMPFLICALGVNNIFLFNLTYQRLSLDPQLYGDREKRVRETCVRVLPSMFATSGTQFVCFLSIALSDMPVLKGFSYYAAVGVLYNFLLTLTLFIPVCVMDAKREESGRYELLCCSGLREVEEIKMTKGYFPRIMERLYAPFIFRRPVRVAILMIQTCLLALACLLALKMPVGLDEKMSMPLTSYAYTFMEGMPRTMAMTMPLHFVVQATNETAGFNLHDKKLRELLCTGAGCDPSSIGASINSMARISNFSLIAQDAYNTVDAYNAFLASRSCCSVRRDNASELCAANDTASPECMECASSMSPFRKVATSELDYYMHIPHFLQTIPTKQCPHGGAMQFRDFFNVMRTSEPGTFPVHRVKALTIMSFNAAFTKSQQYIEALGMAREICDQFTRTLRAHNVTEISVFPYSSYYIYYDQYLHIAESASAQLGLSLGVSFVALGLFMASPYSAILIMLNTMSSTICLAAYMALTGIELNALTIVNLAMSLGVLLEFFVHFVHSYSESGKPERVDRATEALVNVGSTVFCGIVITKFIGLIVLAFAHMQIFHRYYFQFYLGLLPIGAIHGLLFLPVQLTFFGPHLYRRRFEEQEELNRVQLDELKRVARLSNVNGKDGDEEPLDIAGNRRISLASMRSSVGGSKRRAPSSVDSSPSPETRPLMEHHGPRLASPESNDTA